MTESTNVTEFIDQHLYGTVKERLKRKVLHTKDPDYQVRYLGVKGPAINMEKSVAKLAKAVNHYVMAFQTVGQLGDFIKVDLYFGPETKDKEPMSVYVAYICVLSRSCSNH